MNISPPTDNSTDGSHTATDSGADTQQDIGPVLQAAYEWYHAGCNPCPANEDGTKSPAVKKWAQFQTRRIERDNLPGVIMSRTGLGIFTGRVFKPDNSGYAPYGIECFEFDSEAAFNDFISGAVAAGLSGLIDRIRSGYEERTPSGGTHWFYFCESVERNQKLAQEPTDESDEKGNQKRKTLIETRGLGGWVITAPSDGGVHPTGSPYVRTQGSPGTIATITTEERAALHTYARTFDRTPEKTGSESAGDSTRRSQSTNRAKRHFQKQFNAHADWNRDVLGRGGWEFIREADDVGEWRRPGAETTGKDGTTNADGTDRFWPHSTSTVFETDRYYTKFQAYTTLFHNGDAVAAETDLKANWDRESGFRDTAADTSTGPEDTRPVISLSTENVNVIGDKIVDDLHRLNDPPSVFTDANGEIVAPRIQTDGSLTVDHFTEHQLRELIMRAIKFESPGKLTKTNPDPDPVDRKVPMDVVRNVQGRRNLPFPVLTGVVSAPRFAADGTVRLEPGYDPATRTYLHPEGGIDFSDPAFNRDPTPAERRAAVDLLDELIGEFPFVGDADRAHAVAGILQQAAPDLIGGFMPMLAFDKPSPGTGASLLVRSITAPFAGADGAASMTHPRDEGEFEKTLLAKHLQGDSYAFFDNVDGAFGTPLLAEALTATYKDLRVLGKNQMVRAKMPTFWYLTGNNPTYTDDLPRRIVPIRLDAKIARPWERSEFRHRLPLWAWDNRVAIVRAVLTIWKAWLAAGRPKGTRTLGSYERWAETMGGVLDIAGITGFLTNTADFYERSDAEGAAWQSVIDAWWDLFGSDKVTARELLTLPAVSESLGIGISEKDRKAFGIKLRKQRDRRYGDLKVTLGGTNRDKVQTYLLEHHEGIVRPRQKTEGSTVFGTPGDVVDLFGVRA